METPDKQVGYKPLRNAKGQLLPGNSGNLLGRPAGQSLKEYDREQFSKMEPKEKELFLTKVSPETRYKMAEGNPHQTSDLDVKGNLTLSFDSSLQHEITPTPENSRGE